MSLLGQFLELSVPTEDVPTSLAFYRAPGFTEVPVADIRPWSHAAVTDGQVLIGLHGGGLEQPALSFVRPGLAAHINALADAGPTSPTSASRRLPWPRGCPSRAASCR
jgi:hypothetical protein